jgi:poly(3-hydroxybutyrate) depolymerase
MEASVSEKYEIFSYVSNHANTYTPAKTIFVCAPDCFVRSRESVKAFAERSGWFSLAESDGAVLVMPVAENGWEKESPRMIWEIYDETRKKFRSKNNDSIPGREGLVWCWETLVYLVGYGEGAVFAGNAAVATPNRFAGIALVEGVPNDYSPQSEPSDHWLVGTADDYSVTNRELPVCLWMFGKDENDMQETLSYFSASNQITAPAKAENVGGIRTKVYQNSVETAWQIRISAGDFLDDPSLSATIMEHLFSCFIRWKNSPDGTLKPYLSRQAFYASERYTHDSVMLNGIEYPFHVYLPEGMNAKDARSLPVVFSVHGRGEPAWIFATKNGWDRLADETKEFLLVLPDSPQNIWTPERDADVFGCIISRLYETYGIDRTRVYLTGFSNGGIITRQVANLHPEQFAAISPWNAPFVDSFEQLLSSGYEIPCFICAGDSDEKVPLWDELDSLLENMLKANRCALKEAQVRDPMKFIPDCVRTGENYYTGENGYTDGERFKTYLYNNSDGHPRVGFTLMKNMPHGAVYDESRAAWAFLKHFSRPEGSAKVFESL